MGDLQFRPHKNSLHWRGNERLAQVVVSQLMTPKATLGFALAEVEGEICSES